MVIAALVSFAILLAAWIVAPGEASAPVRSEPLAMEQKPEPMRVAA